jgi:competence protein ComEC
MKRPLAVIGFTYITVLVAASYGGLGVNAALALFFLLCAGVTLALLKFLKYYQMITVILATASAALGMWCLAYHFSFEPAAALDGQTVVLRGRVADLPTNAGERYYYVIDVQSVETGGKTKDMKTKVRLSSDAPLPGRPLDYITVKADVYLPASGSGTGYSSQRYYMSKGVYLFARPSGPATVTQNENPPPYYYAVKLRQYISNTLYDNVTGVYGALAAGTLIGETSKLPEEVTNDFIATGISHILAVSGTQTSLICEYILLLLLALKMRRRPAAAVAIAAIAGFMAVTGFSPPVTRAGIMSIIFLLAIIVRRESDALNSLGLSVLLICLVNPFSATDIGLLLSFAATLGMILLSRRMLSFIEQKTRTLPGGLRKTILPAAALLCTTAGATLLTLPVIIVAFGRISVVTFISNLLEVPAALAVTLASAVLVLLSPLKILFFLITPLAMLVRLLTAFMIWYAHALAQLPFATLSARAGFVMIFLVFLVFCTAAYFLFRGRGAKLAVCVVCAAFTLSVGVLSHSVSSRGVMQIAQLPVSNGSCTVISKDGRAVIFDLSGYSPSYAAEQYLKAQNIKSVDALVLPAYDQKRMEAANSLFEAMPTGQVFLPGAYKSEANDFAQFVEQPVTLTFSGCELTLIPSADGKKILMVARYGASSAVLTGGADVKLPDYRLGGLSLKSDVLDFGGSVSKDFAQAVSPRLAQSGEGISASYSAPVLKSLGCEVTSAEGGGVSILTRGNGKYMIKRVN